MSRHQLVDIDPRGDVVLVFKGEDWESSTRMRVSSAALSFGSPVFERMLQSEFKEGQQFKATGYAEIPLEDDLKSMAVMCKALHFQHKAVMIKLSSEELLNVAEVSDKYDCTEALAPLADYWLKDCEANRGTLLAAYLFRRQERFSKMASSFFVDCYDYRPQSTENTILSELWDSLVAAMELQRATIVDDIWDFIENNLCELDDPDEQYTACSLDCTAKALYQMRFRDTLSDNLLTPHRCFHIDHGLGERIRFMEKATFDLPKKDDNYRWYTKKHSCYYMKNAKSGPEWERLFKEKGKEFRKDLPKICFGCVVEGSMFKVKDCKHDEEV